MESLTIENMLRSTVRFLPSFHASNWDTLSAGLKKHYWQLDQPRNIITALNKLIRDGPGIDLNVYILKYTTIFGGLVSKRALSTLGRINRWRLSAQDIDANEAIFIELMTFTSGEAESA
jgi:hypothetical protein